MKSAAFDYVRAESAEQVFDLFEQHGDAMQVLAGGQTLLAALNMRLSHPALLVDIGGLDGLRGITQHDGMLRIGALTRHVEVEESALVAQHTPLLTQAAPHIAHRAIRNRGTFGGALAYADPAAEWPACVLALDGVLVLRSRRGDRRVPAAEFFLGVYTTARAEDELLVACEIPIAPGPERRQHFDELARRHGDYAVAGIAACSSANMHADGHDRAGSGAALSDLRLVFLSLVDRPVRATDAERVLLSGPLTPALLDDAEAALRAEIEPFADLTHSVAVKQQLAATLMRRALRALAG
ncbi:MAG: xanthine dehydrogenase family protein subunit M [Rubrivivax sp.]